MNPLPTAAGKNTSAAPGHNGMNFKQIVQNVCLFNPGFRRHPLVQKYSRLRCPLWKFSSLYKAEALYEGRLKVIQGVKGESGKRLRSKFGRNHY